LDVIYGGSILSCFGAVLKILSWCF